MNGISWIDGLVAVCLVVPAIRGWQSGLVAGLLRLAGILGGAVIGWMLPFAHALCHRLRPELPISVLPWLCAFLGAILGWFLGILCAWLWRRFTKEEPVGWIDRGVGLVLGFSKGAVFVLVLLAAIQTALPGMRSQIRNSWAGRQALAPVVEYVASWGGRHLFKSGDAH